MDIHPVSQETELTLPVAEEKVAAGFPSPAQDYTDLGIDLNKTLIAHAEHCIMTQTKRNLLKINCSFSILAEAK